MQRLLLFYSLLLFNFNTYSTILVLDYGSPIAPYIQYCLQEAQVESVLYPCTLTQEEISTLDPSGIILSGGPFSVYQEGSPQAPDIVFELGVPLLGICYGQQLISHLQGGLVEHMKMPERGPTPLFITDTCLLTRELWSIGQSVTVWMGHEDLVVIMPEGFKAVAHTPGSHFAIIADDQRLWYGVQFHPEAPKNGWPALIQTFALNIVGDEPKEGVVSERKMVDEGELFRSLYYGCCGCH